jgi:hypothetical protein
MVKAIRDIHANAPDLLSVIAASTLAMKSVPHSPAPAA